MKTARLLAGPLVPRALLLVCLLVAGCGGGGGGGPGGAPIGTSTLLSITAQGASAPLWEWVAGAPTTPPVCPPNVFANSAITFTFDGAVAPGTLPAYGLAIGSINVIAQGSGAAAIGTFTVEDDPGLPAGNQRRVVFRPEPPADPGVPCASGLASGESYQVFVPGNGGSQALNVALHPLANEALACFNTCGCPDPGACGTTYVDPIAGAPYVIDTIPASGDPAIQVDACSIAGHTVTIRVNEPLNPAGIDLSNVRIVNVATGAQVPGALVFHQAGSLPGNPTVSQIDYVASGPLLPSVTYEIVFGAGVKDLGGNPIQTSATNPGAHLYFQTFSVLPGPLPPLDETFDTTTYLDSLSGPMRWAGDGVLQVEFPTALTGTGADGAFNPPVGVTTILDTNELVAGQPRQGVWNFTSVNIPATATVRIIGPHLAHLRCLGTFTLNGTINANAGVLNPLLPSTPAYDRGPEQGIQNNNGGLNCEANGGVANAGGGAGGTGSGITPPAGSAPTFQCTVRVLAGENGFGPTLSGQPNTGNPVNPYYAGGQGGISGCFPAFGAGCTVGDLGGLGGAGGTAGRMGEAGTPRISTAACTPTPGVVQPIAQPSPVAAAMIPPIASQSAGSGGAGGGDHLIPQGTPPNNDDQGGGGGGGGGGVHVSCVGAYSQGSVSGGGTIVARGAAGNTAQAQGGAGGSGSGGEVWIQSFSTVAITPTSTIDVTGPERCFMTLGAIGCSNQASGGGGPGLIQIEAGQGPPATTGFNILPMPTAIAGAVFSAPPFQHAGGVVAQARSKFRYAGAAPDYSGAVEFVNPGNALGATLVIRYEGAQEAVNSTQGNPVYDPTTIKSTATGGGPITAANLDELDGYALIRFVVTATYPPPPTTPANAILPSVDRITLNLNGAPPCP